LQFFLDVAKTKSSADSLTQLKNDNDEPFSTIQDIKNYVNNFYSNLYRKDETVGGTVEDFLGPEICTHPVVLNSKLTQAEKDSLESDISYNELTEA
jgi:hypothetical protein